MFKVTLGKSLPGLVLLAMALIPLPIIRQLFFGILGWPFSRIIWVPPFVFRDKGFLTFYGAVLIACIWAVLIFLFVSLFCKLLNVARR